MSDMNISSLTNEFGQSLSRYDVEDKLKDLGIPDDVIAQGESAIEDYAFKNSIDLALLQPELNEKAAPPPLSGSNDKIKTDYESQLKALGVPSSVVAKGKAAVEAYALNKGISLPRHPSSGTALNFKS